MCARGPCTCGCGQREHRRQLEEFDALDELDEMADGFEGNELDDSFGEDDAFTPRTARARPAARSGGLGFVLTCANRQRQQRFRAALQMAISVAENAARQLSPPRGRRISRQAHDLFVDLFGTQPNHRPAWADRTAAGLVAHRYRMVARELAGGRRFRYTCVTGAVGDCAPSAPGRVVLAATTGKSAITLCDAFFGPGRTIAQMAGTILHEGMHAVYQDLFDHAVARGIAECRRDNARCFQSFALRLRGIAVKADILNRCRRSNAQCRRLLRNP